MESPAVPELKTGGPQSFTDEEIFNRLWPPVYQDALQDLENRMIGDGFVAAGEQHQSIRSDEDVYFILSKLIDYAEKNEWIVVEDAAKLRVGLTVDLPQQIDGERRALRENGISTSTILPRNQRFVHSYSDQDKLARDLIDGLKYVLTLHYADAQVGGWHTAPDCYKDLAPLNPVPGFNSLAICCNCGLLCTPYGCTFIPDCGPYSAACNVPLGCLNLNCGLWPNAIWDQFSYPLGTGICGCG